MKRWPERPETDLSNIYRGYTDCLDRQDWAAIGQFVQVAQHNGRPFGLSGYRAMPEAKSATSGP